MGPITPVMIDLHRTLPCGQGSEVSPWKGLHAFSPERQYSRGNGATEQNTVDFLLIPCTGTFLFSGTRKSFTSKNWRIPV